MEIVKKVALNASDFKPLLGLWWDKFMPFLEGEEMYNIYKKLKEDGAKEKIVPEYENVFKVFQNTKPGNIVSIWWMMDPYSKMYKNKELQATGIAMDCSNSPDGKLQPSLEKFYEGMSEDVGKKVEYSKSLDYLLEQGVMMLNTDLTCKLNKTGSHRGLWAPFQRYFLEEVMSGTSGIIYILAGKESRSVERWINPLGNYVFRIDHPVSASYKGTEWNCEGIFTNTNKILEANNSSKIYWDKKEWDEGAPPF